MIDQPNLPRYRCYTGHAYTTRALLEEQSERLERALWAAVRSMEERSNALLARARDSQAARRDRAAVSLEAESTLMRDHAQTLRAILLRTPQA
jgi:two-component system, chemotaxis family, protein-glutamate methylesterase/glutaminase